MLKPLVNNFSTHNEWKNNATTPLDQVGANSLDENWSFKLFTFVKQLLAITEVSCRSIVHDKFQLGIGTSNWNFIRREKSSMLDEKRRLPHWLLLMGF